MSDETVEEAMAHYELHIDPNMLSDTISQVRQEIKNAKENGIINNLSKPTIFRVIVEGIDR